MATCYLTSKQCLKVKSPIMDTNNHLNKIFPAFNSLNKGLSSGSHLVDTFSDCFSSYLANWKDVDVKINYQNKLKNIYKVSSNNQDTILIISDMSVKSNIITLVSYIQRGHKMIVKTIHHAMNILLTEAELFAIRCGINQVYQMQGVTCIVVITDTIHAAKHIFIMSIHLYQLHIIAISNNLRKFFDKNTSNLISFWDCSSNNKWPPHLLVDKKSKFHKISPILPSKMLWEFSKKEECNSIVKK